MPSDQLVSARHVLQSTLELQRRRSRRVLSELEKLEPDLAEYVIENLTQLHHRLVRYAQSTKEARRIYRFAESTLLVSLLSLQKGYRELMHVDHGGDESHTGDPLPPDSQV